MLKWHRYIFCMTCLHTKYHLNSCRVHVKVMPQESTGSRILIPCVFHHLCYNEYVCCVRLNLFNICTNANASLHIVSTPLCTANEKYYTPRYRDHINVTTVAINYGVLFAKNKIYLFLMIHTNLQFWR